MGSVLYQYCGMQCPFLIIAGLCLADGLLRLSLKASKEKTSQHTESGRGQLQQATPLLKDPQILVGLGSNI